METAYIIFTFTFAGVVLGLGLAQFLLNKETASTPVVAVSNEDEYILTYLGAVIVPSTCKPTRRLKLAMLRASIISTPFGCTNDSKVVFLKSGHHSWKAYYIGTK